MPLRFTKQVLSSERYEAAAAIDVNGDGWLDIVSGAFWYEGPAFTRRYLIGPVQAVGEYYDDFSAIALDIDGDGRMDIVTGGWFGQTLRWRQHPGDLGQLWHDHPIAACGNIETTRAWDLDGDGVLELVPNTPNHLLVIYKLVTDSAGRGTGRFTQHTVYSQPQGHGLGCGDIGGNGRADMVLNHGWLEAPADPWQEPWRYHAEFDLGTHASIPIIVADVDGNGLRDLIVGNAHGYGLDWWQQRYDANGRRTWHKHPIDPFHAQYHDLHWVDLDGDGQCELVTGKRYRAHDDNDPGAHDDLGICYFKWNGESFTKHVVAYGPLGTGAGCGIQFTVADLRQTGRLDIIAPGKDGLQVFFNDGQA